MYVNKHIMLGAIFSLLVYLVFKITLFNCILIFLASVLIDVDHYTFYARRKKDFSLKNAYHWWTKEFPKKHKPILNVLHTAEFHTLVLALSFYFSSFIFIFIGLLFHSILDIIYLLYYDVLGCREFSLIRYLMRGKKNYF
jgi:hypothetical protein